MSVEPETYSTGRPLIQKADGKYWIMDEDTRTVYGPFPFKWVARIVRWFLE